MLVISGKRQIRWHQVFSDDVVLFQFISDLNDIILPLPDDLVVNLQDSMKVVEILLDSLAAMFTPQAQSSAGPLPVLSHSCTGSALAVAKHLLEPTGGKILLFQGSLPSLGEGALKQRDNPRLLGTDKEHTLLNSEDTYVNMPLILTQACCLACFTHELVCLNLSCLMLELLTVYTMDNVTPNVTCGCFTKM